MIAIALSIIAGILLFINLLVFFSEIRDFKKRLKEDGIKGTSSLVELEEAWEKTSKKGATILFYPGLILARWIIKRSLRKKLRVLEEREVRLRELKEKV